MPQSAAMFVEYRAEIGAASFQLAICGLPVTTTLRRRPLRNPHDLEVTSVARVVSKRGKAVEALDDHGLILALRPEQIDGVEGGFDLAFAQRQQSPGEVEE